jgi:hypothetical protein
MEMEGHGWSFSLSAVQGGWGPGEVLVRVVMGYKLYTANFKDRIGLRSDFILIHF